MKTALAMTTAAVLAGAAGPAAAQTAISQSGGTQTAISRPGEVILHGTGSRQTATCRGGAATIGGSDNQTVITGGCDRLTVGGSDNEVRVELASGAEVWVGGSRNLVTWTTPRGAEAPRIVRAGEANVVEEGR